MFAEELVFQYYIMARYTQALLLAVDIKQHWTESTNTGTGSQLKHLFLLSLFFFFFFLLGALVLINWYLCKTPTSLAKTNSRRAWGWSTQMWWSAKSSRRSASGMVGFGVMPSPELQGSGTTTSSCRNISGMGLTVAPWQLDIWHNRKHPCKWWNYCTKNYMP